MAKRSTGVKADETPKVDNTDILGDPEPAANPDVTPKIDDDIREWDGGDGSAPVDKSHKKPPLFDWSSFLEEDNPDTVGNQRYQPHTPDRISHDAASYSKKDNLVNETKTTIKQQDPDGNKWKTEVQTSRRRNRFNMPIGGV